MRILQQNSLARHWARDWRALALAQVHHGSREKNSSPIVPSNPSLGLFFFLYFFEQAKALFSFFTPQPTTPLNP